MNIFFQISFLFTADLKGTTRNVFISRYCIIISLAPVIVVEDFYSKILCLQMKSKCFANKILNTKVCVGICRTSMKLMGKFLCSRISSLVRGLFPITGSSRVVRNNGSDLSSRRDISIKILSYNIFENVFFSKSNLFG